MFLNNNKQHIQVTLSQRQPLDRTHVCFYVSVFKQAVIYVLSYIWVFSKRIPRQKHQNSKKYLVGKISECFIQWYYIMCTYMLCVFNALVLACFWGWILTEHVSVSKVCVILVFDIAVPLPWTVMRKCCLENVFRRSCNRTWLTYLNIFCHIGLIYFGV